MDSQTPIRVVTANPMGNRGLEGHQAAWKDPHF